MNTVVDSETDTVNARDPYLVWAEATRFAYLSSHTGSRCRLALQLRESYRIEDLRQEPRLAIPGIYQDPMRYCTAEVSAADETLWDWLHRRASVALAEPGMVQPDGPELCLDPIGPPSSPGLRSPRVRKKLVIGIVDGACGFANRQFRRRAGARGPWQTRLVGFWDQQGSADSAGTAEYWKRPPDLGYGRELQLDALDGLLERHLANAADDLDDEAQAAAERAIYRNLGVTRPAAADWTHGTHVLDTVGGVPTPNNLPQPPEGHGPWAASEAALADAHLIGVQLPEVALRDTSGRWAPALVLDGLRYIVARAGKDADVVINLSLGSFAGPHDGSSMLEQAIDSLIDELEGRLTVVVAAGNAGGPRTDRDGTIRRCHAAVVLEPAGATQNMDKATLLLDIDEVDATETFVELWLPDAKVSGDDFAEVKVELAPPDPHEAIEAARGETKAWRDTEAGVALAQIDNRSGQGGKAARGKGPMVLVAIGTTRDVRGYRAPVGRWRIRVTNSSQAPVELQAWVERRDVPGELPGERPQYGFDPYAHVERPKTNTLGSLANGTKTIVVAAAEFPDDDVPQVAKSSSEGPEASLHDAAGNSWRGSAPRPFGPAVAAVCEFTAAGFLTGSYKTLKGTSMSSAWATRAIAVGILAMGQRPPDVRAWLRGMAGPAENMRGVPSSASSMMFVVPRKA